MTGIGKGSLCCLGILVILISASPYSCSDPATAPVSGQSNNNGSNSGNGSSTTLPPVTPTSTPESVVSTTVKLNNTNQTSTEAPVVTTPLRPTSVTSKSNSSTAKGQSAATTTPTVVGGNSTKSGSVNGTTMPVQSTNASVPMSTKNGTSTAAAKITTPSSTVTDETTVNGSVNTKTTLSPTGTATMNGTETTSHANGSSITIPLSTTQAPTKQTPTLKTTNKTGGTEPTSVATSTKPSTVVTELTNKTQTTVVVTNQSTTITTPKTTVSVTAAPTTTVSSVVTTTASTPEISSTAAPAQKILYINEITVNKQGVFRTIEIQMKDQADLSHYVFVMVDGNTSKTMSVIPLRRFNQTNGLLIVGFSSVSALSNKGIGLAIYYSNMVDGGSTFNDSWVLNEQGVVDALVIGKTYDGISTKLVNVLTPGVDPFVLDPSQYGMEKSISRCSADSVRSTEMFALINPSLGKDNGDKCKERISYKNTLSLQIMMDCGILKSSNNTIKKPLLHSLVKIIVKGINRKCHCGITGMHVLDPQIECCQGTNLDLNFVAPNKKQDDEFLRSFKAYIKDTTEIEVNGQSYHLEKGCNGNCCTEITPSAPKKDNSKDIKVTVGVIVTLLIVFLIIVLVVYMYMRKKKIAVHQFRMSRLEEEDDYDDINVNMTIDDQDEFVGGQEATFDLKT